MNRHSADAVRRFNCTGTSREWRFLGHTTCQAGWGSPEQHGSRTLPSAKSFSPLGLYPGHRFSQRGCNDFVSSYWELHAQTCSSRSHQLD